MATTSRVEIYVDEQGPFPGDLEIEVEEIDISSNLPSYKPDPKWTHVDKAGHFHAITREGKYPTLETYTKHRPCPGGCGDSGCEGTTETRYRCRVCRKRVRPGSVSDGWPGMVRKMPGRTYWTVEVRASWPPENAGEAVVRVVSGDRTWFGVVQYGRASSGPDGVRYALHGIGELGERAS